MKNYTQFIKEVNTSVYGEVSIGSKPSTVTKKSVSSGVDRAIKNYGTGEGSGSTVVKKGGYGISGNVNVSMGGGGKSSNKNNKNKIKPIKTTDPKPTQTSTNNTPRSNGGRPSLVASNSSNSSNIRPNIPTTDRMRNM